jgi:hypothetical protein
LSGAAGQEPVHVVATKSAQAPARNGNWLWIGLIVAVAAALITVVLGNG